MEAGVPLRSETLPWSRILETWAERLGLVGKGGGGIWFGWVSRLRWVADNAVRWGSRWARGEEMDLEVGSKVRGRRVNVGSIASTKGWVGWVCSDRDDGLSTQYSVLVFNPICDVRIYPYVVFFLMWFASRRKRVYQLIIQRCHIT